MGLDESSAVWKSLPHIDGLLYADYSVALFPVPVRCMALRLVDGSYAVFSPARQFAGTFTAGNVRYVIAGNSFHHMGCTVWREHHPDARMLASPAAVPRLKKKGHKEIGNIKQLDLLPDNVQVHEIPHASSGDLIVSIQADNGARAWITFDLVLNITKSKGFFHDKYLRLLNEYPGIKVPVFVKWFVKKDERTQFREKLEALIQNERPTMLIPAHGDVVEDNALPQRMIAALRESFPS